MAMSAKTPPNPLVTDVHLSLSWKPRRPISLNFSPNPPKPQISLKKPQQTSATLNTDPILDPTNLNSRISQLCIQGNVEQALQLLNHSTDEQDPIAIDEDTYISLLRLCQFKRAASEGSHVYAHISSSLSSPARFTKRLGNALLGMLVRFGNMFDAWFVFAKMEERDVFSWNVMVGGYAKAGLFDEALDLYQQMMWVGIKPDVYTFPCVLRTCGGIPDWVTGREVHVHVIRFGFESDIDVVNALITMYAKSGDLYSARKLFDQMPVRDRISWNAMISGYFENGECLEGLKLFMTMRVLSVEPNLMTMTSVITAAELLGDERLGRELHGFMVITGFAVDLAVSNALIHMYVSLLNMEEAEKIFIRMGFRDVVSWTVMMSGYVKNELPMKAVETYEQMELKGVMPDEVAVAGVLSAYTCLGLLDRGIRLHEFVIERGLISHTMVGNMLVDMYMKCGRVVKALEVFKQIPEKNAISWDSMILGFQINDQNFDALKSFRKMPFNLKPNCVAYIAALSACASIGALMCGKEIHAQALRNGLAFEDFIPNALMDMYAKCGRMKYAQTQFNIHENKDVSSWNIMLNGYARQERGDLAVELFDRMQENGLSPNHITFTALLCACSRSGMVNECWDYFDSMSQRYSISPNLKHYTCMVDLLGRAGWLEEAQEFIEKIPIDPDVGVWGAFLSACRVHQRFDLGEPAAQFIFDRLDLQNRPGYHVLLSRFYGDNERWDRVARVRKMMIKKGLTADPGCSWVEVKGTVHAFLTADESHPQMKEIYSVLNGLYERISAAGFDMPGHSSADVIEASKAEIFCGHTERSAIAFGLINTTPGMPIRVTKNLYMCRNCHHTIKLIAKVVRREITVRDTEQFHHFKDGSCSCGDEWYWGDVLDKII
ncbi:hypothetical protein AAC387_Pa03g3539 [Persea americana]